MTDTSRKLPPVHEAWLPREHSLYRPRHGSQVTALVCAAVFFAAPALGWVFGGRPSEIENRELASFPSPADGWGFFTGMPQWATDHLVFREGAIEAADGISHGLFGEPAPMGPAEGSGPIPGVPDGPQGNGNGGDGDSRDEQEQSAGYTEVIEGSDGWLYYGDDVKGKCFPKRPLTETFERLDRIRHAVEASGRRFLLTIAPDKTTMVPQHLPDNYAGKECSAKATERFWELAAKQRSFLDVRPSLEAAERQLGHPPYFANDTHWTDDGAVMLTRDVAEKLQPGVTDTWRSPGVGWSTANGDLASMLGRTEPKTSVRYELMPDGETDRTQDTLRKFDGPERYDADAGKDIEGTIGAPTALIGDSFTFASSRYLPAAFADLTLLSYPHLGKHKEATIDTFVRSEIVVVQTVERSVAEGDLPLLDEGFLTMVERRLAANPIR